MDTRLAEVHDMLQEEARLKNYLHGKKGYLSYGPFPNLNYSLPKKK
jgi:hypothetical protein